METSTTFCSAVTPLSHELTIMWCSSRPSSPAAMQAGAWLVHGEGNDVHRRQAAGHEQHGAMARAAARGGKRALQAHLRSRIPSGDLQQAAPPMRVRSVGDKGKKVRGSMVGLASIPKASRMNDGFSGASSTLRRQADGTASDGRRRSMSGALALETTARAARTVRPPRSRTPALCGGRRQAGVTLGCPC
jgi:hypothetical protein